MNINMSDLFKNSITSNNVQTGSLDNSSLTGEISADTKDSAMSDCMKFLNSLMNGDTFTGFISQLKDNNVLITMNNGMQISARLTDGSFINSGQNITFVVENNNNNQITIKPMLANEQQSVLIDRVLSASDLSATQENIDLVKELLNLGMSVDSGTVSQLAKYAVQYPDADINTLANLYRLDIPVNDSNINEFRLYSQFNGKIEGLMSELENSIINDYNSDNNPDILKTVISSLYDGISADKSSLSAASDILSDEAADYLQSIINNTEGMENTDIRNMSVKDLLEHITAKGKDDGNNSTISDAVNSKAFKELLHAAFNDTMKLTPKDIQSGETAVSSYYKRIRKNIGNIEDSIKDSDSKAPEMQKSLSDIKSNIDFMNDLNKNMTYFQMPIKFSESEGNGELYVFTNKKNLANHSDNISAMLHLDMENLKSMDIYVNLSSGNNVSTNFVLESEELLDFVYQHIDKLNKRLEQLGYNTHFEMKVAKDPDERFDFVKDFIEAETKPSTKGQYIFDVKA